MMKFESRLIREKRTEIRIECTAGAERDRNGGLREAGTGTRTAGAIRDRNGLLGAS